MTHDDQGDDPLAALNQGLGTDHGRPRMVSAMEKQLKADAEEAADPAKLEKRLAEEGGGLTARERQTLATGYLRTMIIGGLIGVCGLVMVFVSLNNRNYSGIFDYCVFGAVAGIGAFVKGLTGWFRHGG